LPAQIPLLPYINIHNTFCSQRNGTLCSASTHLHPHIDDGERDRRTPKT
jgi:hypothetical protein